MTKYCELVSILGKNTEWLMIQIHSCPDLHPIMAMGPCLGKKGPVFMSVVFCKYELYMVTIFGVFFVELSGSVGRMQGW